MAIDVVIGVTPIGSGPALIGYPLGVVSGWGTRYANYAPSPARGTSGPSFAPNGTDLAFGEGHYAVGAPNIGAFTWTPGVGFGTRYANPSTLPPEEMNKMTFAPDNSAVVGSRGVHFEAFNSPFITGYPWTPGVGFGAKYADPATPPPSTGNNSGSYGIGFSPDGATIFLSYDSTSSGAPILSAWTWTAASGFGTKYANASITGTNPVSRSLAIHPTDGTVVVAGGVASVPHLSAFGFHGGFGSQITEPTGILGTRSNGVAFDTGGVAIYTAGATTIPQAWAWAGGAFGIKYADAAGLGNVLGVDIAVSRTASPASTAGFGTKFTSPSGFPSVSAGGTITLTGTDTDPIVVLGHDTVGLGMLLQAWSLVNITPPSQPDTCGPLNLAPQPLTVLPPEPVVRTYPHVTEIPDWATQQSVKLLWDRLHDHESRLRAGLANDEQWVASANLHTDDIAAAQLAADQAMAQAAAGPSVLAIPTGGVVSTGTPTPTPPPPPIGGIEGEDLFSDTEAQHGFGAAGVTGHVSGVVPLTAFVAGQIIGGTATEFPALFKAFTNDAAAAVATEEYTLRVIWHLQQAGFTAGRQRNPSGLISKDKITVFLGGVYKAYDISSGSAARVAMVAHIIGVGPANYVADPGTPD